MPAAVYPRAICSYDRHPQNPGGAPATNKAVQGQTAAQPEGAFLNLVTPDGPAEDS